MRKSLKLWFDAYIYVNCRQNDQKVNATFYIRTYKSIISFTDTCI